MVCEPLVFYAEKCKITFLLHVIYSFNQGGLEMSDLKENTGKSWQNLEPAKRSLAGSSNERMDKL